jgi:diacylglycerol O-acyltransferase 1
MHEFALGVPLRMLRTWAFFGMMLQLPMIHVTDLVKRKLKNDQFGNILFWISFCVIGQPICALLYYHDYLLEHSPHDMPPPPAPQCAGHIGAC